MLNRHQHQLFRFLNAEYFGTIGQLYYGTTAMILRYGFPFDRLFRVGRARRRLQND
jgi:hypothetical protein